MDMLSYGQVPSYVDGNQFPLRHRLVSTGQFGFLQPSMIMEVLPGDVINLKSSKMVRFLPLLAPIMSSVKVREHFFYVPNRIIWDDWKDFITGKNGNLVVPEIEVDFQQVNSSTYPSQTLGHYMRLPVTEQSTSDPFRVSALPLAAYAAIYNEYYRNDYLQDEIYINLVSDVNTFPTNIGIKYTDQPKLKNWSKDYVFGATPNPSTGTNVLLPITTANDVEVYMRSAETMQTLGFDPSQVTPIVYSFEDETVPNTTISTDASGKINALNSQKAKIDPNHTLAVQMNQNAVTIDALRTAVTLQKFLDIDLTGGTKYIDNIMAHWGIRVPDYRAQVPEYLGGSTQYFNISEVLSKSEVEISENIIPVGSMSGYAYSAASSDNIYARIPEHGYVISIISCEPEMLYQATGLEKHWSRKTRMDFPTPEFANLGAQMVMHDEIYYKGNTENPVWGYRPQYDEYKQFRSFALAEAIKTLDYWTNAIVWPESLGLNDVSIQMDQRVYDLDKIFAVDTNGPSQQIEDYILYDTMYDGDIYRKFPRFNVPNLSGGM